MKHCSIDFLGDIIPLKLTVKNSTKEISQIKKILDSATY
jgi:hypothetical protein